MQTAKRPCVFAPPEGRLFFIVSFAEHKAPIRFYSFWKKKKVIFKTSGLVVKGFEHHGENREFVVQDLPLLLQMCLN